jgi:hypothetical protein
MGVMRFESNFKISSFKTGIFPFPASNEKLNVEQEDKISEQFSRNFFELSKIPVLKGDDKHTYIQALDLSIFTKGRHSLETGYFNFIYSEKPALK